MYNVNMIKLKKVPWLIRLGAVLGLVVMSVLPVQATKPGYAIERLAKAVPDEYFYGIGSALNNYVGTAFTYDYPDLLSGVATAKVNQAYVWGMTKTAGHLWIGTGPNVDALMAGQYLRQTNATFMGDGVSVMEFGDGIFGQTNGLSPEIGDWRPPDMFSFELATSNLVNLALSLPPAAEALRLQTLGFRSAGASPGTAEHTQGLVFLAGPHLTAQQGGGINLFAFDALTGDLVAATNMPAYSNIRKWVIHNGVLYTAVAAEGGTGRVLRWNNNPAQAGYPFVFSEVGVLDNQGAELAVHEGRLFVTTWPTLDGNVDLDNPTELYLKPAALWMSPLLGNSGLDESDAHDWIRVWKVTDYEANPVVAVTYGGGALASFNGWLYWGTMHVPFVSTFAHMLVYGTPTNTSELVDTALKTWRGTSVFRGKDFKEPIEILGSVVVPGGTFELLSGYENMYVYDENTQTWSQELNKMQQVPRWGQAGLGNMFNNYCWTMGIYRKQLYIGTMETAVNTIFAGVDLPFDEEPVMGADLYKLRSHGSTPSPVFLDGAGNRLNYGVRTMISSDEALYLGMANPRNLMTNTNDVDPEGGWELIRVVQDAPPNLAPIYLLLDSSL